MSNQDDYARCSLLVARSPKSVPTNWLVFTGAPSSGKTTLLQRFALRGYSTNDDVTRAYIERRMMSGVTSLQVREDALELQRSIFCLMVDNALSLEPQHVMLHDYALPDNIVYLRAQSLPVPRAFRDAALMFKYRSVFIFEPLAMQPDGVRTETEIERRDLHELTWNVYEDLGYRPIAVPAGSVESRMEFVSDHL